MKHILLLLLILSAPSSSFGQWVQGRVVSQTGIPLPGATIYWQNSRKGVITDDQGAFSIRFPKAGPYVLLVSHTGYATDTLAVTDTSFVTVSLKEQYDLDMVTVQASRRPSYIANSPIKTEVITNLELKKAACCDLAGCFETQSTVQPQTTNIVTNSKELRILGLSGIYNQILVDGFPMIQGLTYTYGISSIPGPLVDNIWIAKGANSVLQGYESISGQINVLTKDPGNTDKLFLNGYINNFGEKHVNVQYGFRKKKWSNVSAFHMVQPSGRIDRDADSFLDLPLLKRYMLSTRWKKGDESQWGWSTQFAVRYLSENRIGGQTFFDYEKDKGTTDAYGQAVRINQPEAWFKTAYKINNEHRFAFYASSFYQSQLSYFGVTHYKAQQLNGYVNFQYEYSYKNSSVLKTGVSNRYLNLTENILFRSNTLNRTYAGRYNRVERIPGVFAENTLNLYSGKLTWINGIRVDHHNQFGWVATPRMLIRYKTSKNLDLRASIGRGWRTANIFSENIGLMVSSRDILFTEPLQPEKAINMGFNMTRKFKGKQVEGYVSMDFYRTNFQNQIFPDVDADPGKAIIRNFLGKSVSNGFQAEVSGTFFNRFAAKLGYVYLDVYQVKNETKRVLPFNTKDRLHFSASYMPISKRWHVDMNMHWYGKQRLPDTRNNPVVYQMPEFSRSFLITNLQYTYNIKKWEVYVGVENLFNFRQVRPIISWQDPFGKYFDTQFAWGPTRGRETYMGFRFAIK